MSDPDDIVGKADAFLGRYRPGTPGDVPVLTEVVEAPGAASAPLSEAQLRDLERRVTQRVLEAIQQTLSGLLEQARDALAEQVRAQAETIVSEAVASALEREIGQLRKPGG